MSFRAERGILALLVERPTLGRDAKDSSRSLGMTNVSRRDFVASVVAAPLVARFGRLAASQEHVVVVGAGAFGGWTALYLREMGVNVTLVDAYGAGNARASSGGETRSCSARASTPSRPTGSTR